MKRVILTLGFLLALIPSSALADQTCTDFYHPYPYPCQNAAAQPNADIYQAQPYSWNGAPSQTDPYYAPTPVPQPVYDTSSYRPAGYSYDRASGITVYCDRLGVCQSA